MAAEFKAEVIELTLEEIMQALIARNMSSPADIVDDDNFELCREILAPNTGKRGAGGIVAKMRMSLNSPDSKMKVASLIKCAFVHFHGIQLMRGQVCMSNPDDHVDIATTISNIVLDNLLSAILWAILLILVAIST